MGNGLTHETVATVASDGVSELQKDQWNAKHVISTLELTGVITPAALTVDTNDYAPTGAAGASVWRVSSSPSGKSITGIAAMTDGTILVIQSVSGSVRLRHEDTGSAAANRIRLPSGSTHASAYYQLIANGLPAILIYNAVAQRWDLLSPYLPSNALATNFTFTAGSSVQLIASANYATGQYGIYADTGQLVLYINGSQGTENQTPVVNSSGQLAWRDGITPTIPTVVSVGAEFTSTGTPTATLPGTHAANDILILAIQTSNENFAAPAGYTRLGPQNGHGASAAAGSTRLALFWKRDGGSESAPTLSDSGDHTYGFMVAIRGCPTTGDPFHLLSNQVKRTASTSASLPGGVTSVDECLILQFAAHAVDNASGQAGAATNADLASIVESFDDSTTDGNGGGIVLLSARKALAGIFGASTFTWSNSTVEVCTTLAMLPTNANLYRSTRAPEVQTFFGSTPAIADTWVKPSGATRVQVEAIGGGGSGGAGRNAATAEGGGSGGGGAYQEKWFTARELGATAAVTAGNGGAATANSDGTNGNDGAASTFGSSPTLVSAGPGRGGVGAITADGGNGGAGGGLGSAPAAAAVTQVFGQAPAPGGNGTTSPVGGSNAEYGGGGGESGADTDAGSTPGGSSQYGGGGGSSGRAAGTVSSAGAGGGASSPTATAGTAGNDSSTLPLGGSGGIGGNSTTAAGIGGFPAGGGGGGGTGSGSQRGERGGHGCVVVTTYFS